MLGGRSFRTTVFYALRIPLSRSVALMAMFAGIALVLYYLVDLETFHPIYIIILSLFCFSGAVLLYLSTCAEDVSIPLYCLGCILLISLIIITFGFIYANITVSFDHLNDGFRFPSDFDQKRWQLSALGRQYLVRNYALYYSAITYFTVGYGDMHPLLDILRFTAAFEAMVGYIINIFIITVGVSTIVNRRNR